MTGAERNRARRQRLYWDLRLFGLPAWVRDLVTLGAAALALWAVFAVQSDVERQRQGRKIAIEVLCAGQQATIDAGREQILASAAIQPPGFARNLELLGLPVLKVRQAGARRAARQYAIQIARAVERESGVRGLVAANGRLRCDRLVRASRAANP